MRFAVCTILATLILAGTGLAAEFKGHACTRDCSGHKAGYAWAAKKGITDPADCRGRSKSFVAGCRIYALERQAGKKSK